MINEENKQSSNNVSEVSNSPSKISEEEPTKKRMSQVSFYQNASEKNES